MFKDLIKRKLTAYLQTTITPDIATEAARRVINEQRREKLLDAALHAHTLGAGSYGDRTTPVVVSLTTHGDRLYEACLAIESIMQGTVHPDCIVLWLDENDARPLPVTLQRQINRGLQVCRTKDIRSYTKLLPALRQFSDADIVTIDDDIFYPYDFLEALLATHRTCPQAIVANVVMKVSRDSEGIPQGILQWPYITEQPADDSDLFFEGFGGVLYPAGCLTDEVFNEQVFKEICPTADDVWFNAMARLARVPIHLCQRGHYDFIEAANNVCQDSALNLINNSDNRNDCQIRAVWQHYNLQGK